MKHLLPLILLALIPACAKQTPVPAPEAAAWSATSTKGEPLAGEEGMAVEAAARVKAVNLKERLLTVEKADGERTTIKVGPAVKRLDEIRAGDMIKIHYTESLAFEVRPPTAEELKNPDGLTVAAVKSVPGEAPAGGAAEVRHAILKVVGVHHQAGTVTLKGPAGRVFTVRAKKPENLHRVKVGDTIAVTYTEAVAVAVEPDK